jgi:hypothetical protein
MSRKPVFRDAALQRRYEQAGYVTFPLLGPAVVRELTKAYESLTVLDPYGIGYKVSLYSDLETRRVARELLIEKAFSALEPLLVDRFAYMATFLTKEPRCRAIPAHQDWSHCDESKHDSLMCWIPLCDTDERNGALGFIPGSHRFFDYLRVFPYLVVRTPVACHENRLTSYLDLVPMRAGDVVVFNNRTVHGSLDNQTPERRLALSFALHPKEEPLLCYYLKPNTQGRVALRYRATPDFYLRYPNPTLGEHYGRGTQVAGFEADEVPYEVPTVAWPELEAALHASGNRVRREPQ